MSLPPPDPTAVPLYDFPNDSSLHGLMQEFQTSLLKNTDDMLPATVIAYNRTSNIATVQPAIHMVTTDGTLVGRAQVASVPVLALGGGNFFVNFPLVPGSRGWIKANDRDISTYLQSGAAAAPQSRRMHNFSNGIFIPDIVNGYTINGEDAANMVISSVDGTVRISLAPDAITLTAPTVNINGVFVINETPFLNYRATGVEAGDETGSGLVA